MPGIFDRAGPASSSRITLPAVSPSACYESVGIPIFIVVSRLNSPARTPPVNASLRPHGIANA